MKCLATYIICILTLTSLYGQTEIIEGEVSYLSSQNVYVKFLSTSKIEIGDTLFIKHGGGAIISPAILVISKSSISCVGKPLDDLELTLKISDKIVAVITSEHISVEPEKVIDLPPEESGEEVISTDTEDPTEELQEPEKVRKQEIMGRLSASMYSNSSTESSTTTSRMRYAFNLRARNINQSKLSLESNLSFRHRTDEPMELAGQLNDYLKIYRLAADYEISPRTNISFGRSSNRRISNMGAIDGFQFEHRFNQFSIGTLIGFRPDYQDFGLNPNLMQGGLYISHESSLNNKRVLSTLAFVEQKNHWKTDRRYAYFQHSSTLLKNLNFFTSFEIDLFQNIGDQPQSMVSLSSIYLSLRYRASRKLTLFGSYDARKNVIYYESYKSYIDQLIDQETRQGYRLRVTYRPIKYLSVGVSGGYRSQNDLPRASKNLRANLTYSKVPILKLSATATATFLQSAFLDGRLFGLRLTREIVKGKISGGALYRNVHYQYLSSESILNQHIVGVSLSWRIQKKLSLSLSFEGTFEKQKRSDRIRLNLIKRFRS